MSTENKDNLAAAKKAADAKVAELEKALAEARKEAETKTIEYHEAANKDKETPAEIETAAESKSDQEEKKTEKAKKDKTAAAKKAKSKKGEDESLEQSRKKKSIQKAHLEAYRISQKNRKQGKLKVGDGNKVRHSVCDVYVYLVDDNELQLKVLQEKFKNTRSFRKTEAFNSGESCLSYIKKHKYPKRSIILVIADFHLDDTDDEETMNGIDLLGELKAYDPDIEVIMLSGSEDPHVVRAAAKYGASNFIQKGSDSFKKTLNTMLWAVREKDSVRKQAESKDSVQKLGIAMVIAFIILFVLGYFVFPDIFRFM